MRPAMKNNDAALNEPVHFKFLRGRTLSFSISGIGGFFKKALLSLNLSIGCDDCSEGTRTPYLTIWAKCSQLKYNQRIAQVPAILIEIVGPHEGQQDEHP